MTKPILLKGENKGEKAGAGAIRKIMYNLCNNIDLLYDYKIPDFQVQGLSAINYCLFGVGQTPLLLAENVQDFRRFIIQKKIKNSEMWDFFLKAGLEDEKFEFLFQNLIKDVEKKQITNTLFDNSNFRPTIKTLNYQEITIKVDTVPTEDVEQQLISNNSYSTESSISISNQRRLTTQQQTKKAKFLCDPSSKSNSFRYRMEEEMCVMSKEDSNNRGEEIYTLFQTLQKEVFETINSGNKKILDDVMNKFAKFSFIMKAAGSKQINRKDEDPESPALVELLLSENADSTTDEDKFDTSKEENQEDEEKEDETTKSEIKFSDSSSDEDDNHSAYVDETTVTTPEEIAEIANEVTETPAEAEEVAEILAEVVEVVETEEQELSTDEATEAAAAEDKYNRIISSNPDYSTKEEAKSESNSKANSSEEDNLKRVQETARKLEDTRPETEITYDCCLFSIDVDQEDGPQNDSKNSIIERALFLLRHRPEDQASLSASEEILAKYKSLLDFPEDETGLTLAGDIAIEDELQDDVAITHAHKTHLTWEGDQRSDLTFLLGREPEPGDLASLYASAEILAKCKSALDFPEDETGLNFAGDIAIEDKFQDDVAITHAHKTHLTWEVDQRNDLTWESLVFSWSSRKTYSKLRVFFETLFRKMRNRKDWLEIGTAPPISSLYSPRFLPIAVYDLYDDSLMDFLLRYNLRNIYWSVTLNNSMRFFSLLKTKVNLLSIFQQAPDTMLRDPPDIMLWDPPVHLMRIKAILIMINLSSSKLELRAFSF